MRRRKRIRDDDKPLTATVLEHMVYSERRLKVLGEVFRQHGMNLHNYLKRYRKKIN